MTNPDESQFNVDEYVTLEKFEGDVLVETIIIHNGEIVEIRKGDELNGSN
jgi:hypothetical protein